MITPIQPVSAYRCAAAPMPCDLRLSLACALTFRTLYGCWFCPAVVIEEAQRPDGAACDRAPELPAKRQDDNARVQQWQAWPAALPRGDRPLLWWPANELPPIPPPPSVARVPIPAITLPAPTYGRLELWA